MAITIAAVCASLDGLKLKYQQPLPNRITLHQALKSTTLNILVTLEQEGRFLRMRTFDFATCPADHPRFDDVAERLTRSNHDYGQVSYSWDRTDGEVVAEVFHIVEDAGRLTEDQIGTLYGLLCAGCDTIYPIISPLIANTQMPPPVVPAPQPRQPPLAPEPFAPPRQPSTPVVTEEDREERRARTLALIVIAVGVLLAGLAGVGFFIWRVLLQRA